MAYLSLMQFLYHVPVNTMRALTALIKTFPFFLSLDLARGPISTVSKAVENELSRFNDNCIKVDQVRFSSVEDIINHPATYSSSPIYFYIIPTNTDWTILWNNSFHCNGHDSLCHCLTKNHKIETIHYLSSDIDAFYQAGSSWTHRLPNGAMRNISCIKEDKKWIWYTSGEVQDYEEQHLYTERIKRKRFNNNILQNYLRSIGCNPNEQPFDFSAQATFIQKTNVSPKISHHNYEYVLQRCS